MHDTATMAFLPFILETGVYRHGIGLLIEAGGQAEDTVREALRLLTLR